MDMVKGIAELFDLYVTTLVILMVLAIGSSFVKRLVHYPVFNTLCGIMPLVFLAGTISYLQRSWKEDIVAIQYEIEPFSHPIGNVALLACVATICFLLATLPRLFRKESRRSGVVWTVFGLILFGGAASFFTTLITTIGGSDNGENEILKLNLFTESLEWSWVALVSAGVWLILVSSHQLLGQQPD